MTDPVVIVLKPTAMQLAFADEIAFREAISGIPTHNYLNGAYHDAKVHYLSPPYDWHWKVPALTVPLRVRRLLRASEVVAELKAQIAKARDAIERSKSYLDKEITRQIGYFPDGPHPPMHPSIVVSRVEKEGYAPCWAYTFNGYDLALVLLNDYEQFIDETMRSRRADFTKIARIHRQAEWYSDSVSLVDSEMTSHALKGRI